MSDAPRPAVPDETLLAQLHAESPAAAQMLGLLSFLGPEPVPLWLLAGGHRDLPSPLSSAAAAGEGALAEEARCLVGFGVARREPTRGEASGAPEASAGVSAATSAGEGLRIPGEVAEKVRSRMSVRERSGYGALAVRLLHEAFPQRIGRPEDLGRREALAPHALAVARHPRGGGRSTAEAVHLLVRVGVHHRAGGDPERARAALEVALEVAERDAPVEGPLRAVAADELASVLVALERPAEAGRVAERALELARETLPADSPQRPMLLSNVAATFREAGRLGRASDALEGALEAVAAAGSPAAEPLELELRLDLADLRMKQERWEEAGEAAARGLEISERIHGEAHPQTARAAWMVGDSWLGRARPDRAAEHFRRSLAAEEARAGPESPAVGQKALALALHLEESGRVDEARALYRKAAAAFETALGADADATRAARAHMERLTDP